METSGGARRRVGVMSKVACTVCRRLKMKCVGAEKPPCAQCAKTGRLCIIPQSNKRQKIPVHARHFQNSSQHCLSPTPQISKYASQHPEKESRPEHENRRDFQTPAHRNYTSPIPVSGPGFEPAASQAYWSSTLPRPENSTTAPAFAYNPGEPSYDQGRRYGNAWAFDGGRADNPPSGTFLNDHPSGVSGGRPNLPKDEDVFHMSRFFIENLLPHIPVVREHDLTDLRTSSAPKKLLTYCIAYVGARFIPGCEGMRSALTSIVMPVARLQLGLYDDSASVEQSQWIQLQALAVLYNWAPLPSPDSSTNVNADTVPAELRQDILRASIETLAKRYSLHSTTAAVTELLKLNVPNVQESTAFRKCLYWLWLFSEAHFRALVLHSPPSIREDANIMQAVRLLDNLVNDECSRQILARVELCLLWSRMALREGNLSEWWCNIPIQVNLETALALLDDIDEAMRSWYQKWHPPQKASLAQRAARAGKDAVTNIFHHFTCFYISNHVARVLQSSTSIESLPPSRIFLLTKTIERGNTLCNSFLELSPLAKYSLCFSPEILFATIAACCDALLSILGLAGERGPTKAVQANTIRRTAELIVDLSIDEKLGSCGRGHYIVARLLGNGAFHRPSAPQRLSAREKRSQTWTATGGEHQAAHTLLSFLPVTDDILPIAPVAQHRGATSGHQSGFNSVPEEGVGMWASYPTSESLPNTESFWTT